MLIIKFLFVVLNSLIGIYDFSFYRIPNFLLGTLLVLYSFFAVLYLDTSQILVSLLTGAVVLIACLLLYALKLFGAGDSKFLTVASLWAGFPGVISLLIYMAILGGVLGIIYLALRPYINRLSDLTWSLIQKLEKSSPLFEKVWLGSGSGPEKGKRENIAANSIPYGVAIAAGSIIYFIFLHN